MKNVNEKYVEGIRNDIAMYKEYESVHSYTINFAKNRGYTAYNDIIEDIEEHIEDTLNSIMDYLNCLYEDWSGLTQIKEEFRKTNNLFSQEFYDIEDSINEKNNEEYGTCQVIVSLDNYSYHGGYFPANFMKEFIQEYGCFTIDIHNNAWIM